MDTKRNYDVGGCMQSACLGNGPIYLNELQREVEGTIEIIEALVHKTQWLSAEDRMAVFDWIDAQQKAASDYYSFILERTKQAKIDIMRSIDATCH